MNSISKIYLDACCLNRPFDDQTQDRIKIETESIIIILKNARLGKIKLIGSDVLKLELEKTPDPIRKSQLRTLLSYYAKFTSINNKIQIRSSELVDVGFSPFDAFHIACAEKEKVNAFLTTDDKIVKLYLRNAEIIKIKINNPIKWIQDFI